MFFCNFAPQKLKANTYITIYQTVRQHIQDNPIGHETTKNSEEYHESLK